MAEDAQGTETIRALIEDLHRINGLAFEMFPLLSPDEAHPHLKAIMEISATRIDELEAALVAPQASAQEKSEMVQLVEDLPQRMNELAEAQSRIADLQKRNTELTKRLSDAAGGIVTERKQWNGSWFCHPGCTYWHDGYHVEACHFLRARKSPPGDRPAQAPAPSKHERIDATIGDGWMMTLQRSPGYPPPDPTLVANAFREAAGALRVAVPTDDMCADHRKQGGDPECPNCFRQNYEEIGRELCRCLKQHMPEYSYLNCPTEVIGDLLTQIDDLMAAPPRSPGALETLIGNDTPWPLADVLARLADAADHLLSVHDCDMQGWEGVGVARDKAREIVAALRPVASPGQGDQDRHDR